MAKQELQLCANRFARATRVGALQYRDDRSANRFHTSQVFEINGFWRMVADQRGCQFTVPSSWITNTLLMPEKKERRSAFNLPYPFQMTHIIDMESPTINNTFKQSVEPKCSLQNEFVESNRTCKFGAGYWLTTYSLNIKANSVPVEQVDKYRDFVNQVWKKSFLHLNLLVGYSRPRPPRGFGELPAPGITVKSPPNSQAPLALAPIDRTTASVTTGQMIANPVATISQQSSNSKAAESRHSHRRRQRKLDQRKVPVWLIVIGIGAGILILFTWLAILARPRP